jgi:hypothetical protein
MLTLAFIGCVYGEPTTIAVSNACHVEQTIEIIEADGAEILRLDLDGSMQETIARVEVCTYSAYWLCVPCDVLLYGTDPDMQPYPDNAQAFVQDCAPGPVTYRVTRQACR